MGKYRPFEQRWKRLGGIRTTSRRSSQGDIGLQSTGSRPHHVTNDSHDGLRLHTCRAGYSRHDSRHPDGTHRMFPQRRSRLQNHQLGKYRVNSRHAAHVASAGKDRCIRFRIRLVGARTGHIRTFRLDGRHLFHYLATHHVYQQYGNGCAPGSHCIT